MSGSYYHKIRSRLPDEFVQACRRYNVAPTRWCLVASVLHQRISLYERLPVRPAFQPCGLRRHCYGGDSANHAFYYRWRRDYIMSSSRFGIGQRTGSQGTPLGLHRVARKIGGGHPVGAVFVGRVPVGLTWDGKPDAKIVHRILWLDGLEHGLNRGGDVDSYRRYIYIHGVGEELTLGKPASCGCLHLSGSDLIPLFDLLPVGTLVWISAT